LRLSATRFREIRNPWRKFRKKLHCLN
jgi:hypothetical protein